MSHCPGMPRVTSPPEEVEARAPASVRRSACPVRRRRIEGLSVPWEDRHLLYLATPAARITGRGDGVQIHLLGPSWPHGASALSHPVAPVLTDSMCVIRCDWGCSSWRMLVSLRPVRSRSGDTWFPRTHRTMSGFGVAMVAAQLCARVMGLMLLAWCPPV